MPVFTATDGTKFEDRNAWRRYEFETQYTFRNKSKEKLEKVPGKINGQPFDLSDLDECEVTLLDQCDQVQIDNVTKSRVFIGPCCESVFIRNCTDCTFTVACKQLRTRDCSNCTISLYSLTDPIIETSSNMKFAPFNGAYCGIEQHFKDARLEPTNNHWSQVYDFNDPSKSGENWCLLKPSEQPPAWVVNLDHVPNAASFGPCINPVPRDAGFIQYDESGSSASSMQSFTFTTTQEQAQKVVEAAATPVETPPPQATVGALPLPPPAPTSTENQKIAVIESAEPLTPPPCPSSSCCSTKTVQPANAEQALTQQLQDVMTLT